MNQLPLTETRAITREFPPLSADEIDSARSGIFDSLTMEAELIIKEAIEQRTGGDILSVPSIRARLAWRKHQKTGVEELFLDGKMVLSQIKSLEEPCVGTSRDLEGITLVGYLTVHFHPME